MITRYNMIKIDGDKLKNIIKEKKKMSMARASLLVGNSKSLIKNVCERGTINKTLIIAIEAKLGIAPEEYVIKDEAQTDKQNRILTTADLDVICDIIKEELNKYFNKFDEGEEK